MFEQRIAYGAAYYDEYMPLSRVEEDMALMEQAGMNIIRIAESTWSTWEPREGEFDFTSLNRVLQAARRHHIQVIVGTPTYAIPPWLARKYPDILAETPDLCQPEQPVSEVKDGRIDFYHVNFSYKHGSGKNALSDIDLHIASGETIGVIGGTGSGKSSLVNLICRLYDVSEGRVSVGGVDVRKYDMETLRNQVAVVLQKNTLFSGTIVDNLRWGNPDATEAECIEACKAACADEFIDRMPEGYHTRIERGGANVSGGQKQRLCIARALLKNPKVLILDDSTSAVDTATDAKIRHSFAEKIPGTTVFIIAQRISSIEHADHVLVLDGGRIQGWGTPQELLETNAIYREIYESQMQGGGDFDQPA